MDQPVVAVEKMEGTDMINSFLEMVSPEEMDMTIEDAKDLSEEFTHE